MPEYTFPVAYLIDEELDSRFAGKEGDLAWLRQHLRDASCVVFNAPRPLRYEYSDSSDECGRQIPGLPTGFFAAAVWPMRDAWNARCVKSNHEDKACVLRLVTQAQARQMVIDDLPDKYRETWLANGLVDAHWRASFANRFGGTETDVVTP
ncbi:MAG: hypothetical protein IPK79_00555 [Vampirovibrionales bacterium]|nr:hypothetical protein [Vampirovibrionales bacterium]